MTPIEILQKHSEAKFGFDTQFNRSSVLCFIPVQANSSVTEIDDNVTGGKRNMTWYQLIGQYKSAYTSNGETGELLSDNATIKTMKIKFPPESVEGVTASRFKDFFDKHYVGKQALILNIISESPTFERQAGKSVPVKNSTDILVDPTFKLIDFIKDFEASQKKI